MALYFGNFNCRHLGIIIDADQHVNDILVFENRNFSFTSVIKFKAGDHDIKIDMDGNLKEWSCKVFVDDVMFIKELFAEELTILKKRRANSRKFLIFLTILVAIVLFLSFLKGLYQGYVGAG